jgi:hypothetical protein
MAVRAILVAPHAVFIDHNTRTGHFTLANPSAVPEEVEVEVAFGYPATDSMGNPYVKLIETPDGDAPSAAAWIRAFPRRALIQPGQRQMVRLLATPPGELPDGEYWARIIVTSRRATTVANAPDTSLRAGLTLELRTITSLMYRKGKVDTEVIIADLRPQVQHDSLVVWVDFDRRGNAAFLGTVRFDVSDQEGSVVQHWKTPVAVYYPHRRRFGLPLDSLAPGSYQVRVQVDTQRDDLPQQQILPAPPITRSFEFEKR